MVDLALGEQLRRMLFALLLGLILGPLWLAAIRIGGRRLWRRALEFVLEALIVLIAVVGLAVATSFSLRAWVFIAFGAGVGSSLGLLRGIGPPWQEFRPRRRN